MKCVYHYYRDQPGLICKTILFRSEEKEKNNCGLQKRKIFSEWNALICLQSETKTHNQTKKVNIYKYDYAAELRLMPPVYARPKPITISIYICVA